MQGVILAIAKARQTFDRDGSEAGLIKVSLFKTLLLTTQPSSYPGGNSVRWEKVGLKLSFVEVKQEMPFPVQLSGKQHCLLPLVGSATLCCTCPRGLCVVIGISVNKAPRLCL